MKPVGGFVLVTQGSPPKSIKILGMEEREDTEEPRDAELQQKQRL
jgi:hypothetical protein